MRRTSRDEVFRLHAAFCKALGDANRLLLIVELAAGERTVNELARAIGASQPLTSRHLGVLREKRIVQPRRDGSFVRYRLLDRRVVRAIELLLDAAAVSPTAAAPRTRPR